MGLICIIRGGDIFVDAASRIAEISGIPPFVIGATVVSVATTLPELLVSVMAAANGQPDMAAGNAVGSVTANTSLILGLTALCAPPDIQRAAYLKRSAILFAAVILLWIFSLGGRLTVIGACAMLLLFGYYMYSALREAKEHMPPGERAAVNRGEGARNALYFAAGAAAIVIGSRLLIDNGTLIARDILHIDERAVSLTMVAIGTSLPELVTAVTAMVKRRASLTIGNILGANIIDTLLILPVCSLIGGGLGISPGTVWVDLPFCLLAAAVLLVPALISGRFYRFQGALAIGLYIMYVLTVL